MSGDGVGVDIPPPARPGPPAADGGTVWDVSPAVDGARLAGRVHVWTARSAGFAADEESLCRSLPADERRRADELLDATRRRQFVHGRVLLRSLLLRYFGPEAGRLTLDILPDGKPVAPALVAGGWHFGLAHSADLVAVALSGAGAVGLDVERIRPVSHIDTIARTYFTGNERAWLASMPDEPSRSRAFLSLWTCKEAVAKATGRGISAGWHEFEIVRDGESVYAVETGSNDVVPVSASWRLVQPVLAPGFVAAVATERPVATLVYEWPNGKKTG